MSNVQKNLFNCDGMSEVKSKPGTRAWSLWKGAHITMNGVEIHPEIWHAVQLKEERMNG